MDLTNELRWRKHLWRNATRKKKFMAEGVDFLSLSQLTRLADDRVKPGEVCHVIGSGASIFDTISLINDADFVVGFEFTGLISEIAHDVIFFDHGGRRCEAISKQCLEISDLLEASVIKIFKNWEMKDNDPFFIRDNWSSRAKILHDIAVMNYKHSYTEYLIGKSLSKKSDIFVQIQNTTSAGIVLGFHLGYKEIVLHGVDLGGDYFYSNLPSYLHRLTPLHSHKQITKSTKLMNQYVPVLKVLKSKLTAYGVNLTSASSSSGSSHVLGTFAS